MTTSREELELVAAVLGGDERAMEELADGYFPGLYRFARARLGGDGELARDVVQTTVCKVLGKLSTYRGESPLAAWLCACCRNEIGMYWRRRGHGPVLVELDEDAPPPTPASGPSREPEPEAALLRKERAAQVHEALDLLPPRYARALEWKYVQGASVREIAARLEVGAKAAESLLTRARNAFRQTYEQLITGGSEGSAAPGASTDVGVTR